MAKWRILSTPELTGAQNMGLDEMLLRSLEEGKGQPCFRLYSWKPWCLSLGNSQKVGEELNIKLLQEDGIDVVRRFTGGRAVLHAQEITYSVIGLIEEDWSASLKSTYEFISQTLLDGLQGIGFQGGLERGDVVDRREKGMVAKPCFSSTSRSELVFNTKKLVGSAQRRTRTAYVQHGSILLNKAHLDLAKYLNLAPDEQISYQDSLRANSISLSEAIGRIPTFEECEKALKQAWNQKVSATETPLTATELKNLIPWEQKYLEV